MVYRRVLLKSSLSTRVTERLVVPGPLGGTCFRGIDLKSGPQNNFASCENCDALGAESQRVVPEVIPIEGVPGKNSPSRSGVTAPNARLVRLLDDLLGNPFWSCSFLEPLPRFPRPSSDGSGIILSPIYTSSLALEVRAADQAAGDHGDWSYVARREARASTAIE